MNFIVYLLATFGVVYVIGHSAITAPARFTLAGQLGIVPGSTKYLPVVFWRRWVITLLECPACLGWWLGLAAGWQFGVIDAPSITTALNLAFVTAASNFILGRATGLIGNPQED